MVGYSKVLLENRLEYYGRKGWKLMLEESNLLW